MNRPVPSSSSSVALAVLARVSVLAVGLAGFALPALSACDDKSSAPAAVSRSDAGTDKYVTADTKLTHALQAAESASGGTDNGPPPEGIFAEGMANRRHPKGKATTFEVASDGAEPRVVLAPAAGGDARPGDYGPAGLRLGEQRGRSARPTVDFTFVLGPAKKDDGGADWLVASIKKAVPAPAAQQLGALPPGMDKEIGSLAGTDLRLQLTSDGRVGDVGLQLGKAAQPELQLLAQSAAETLAIMTIPLPARPLGVGAQWIAESRMPYEGLDVVAYRAFRVKSITDSRVHLMIDMKAYAADKHADVNGIPKEAVFAQFDAELQGEMEMVRGESLARTADLQERLTMIFQAPGAPPPDTQGGMPQMGMIPLQLQVQATLVRGEDLRAASAKQ
ncbi:MAG: hypothetical protein ACRENE_26555 [Polyangiaceae bacterium]